MAENTRFGREPIEVADIGQDFCSRDYGSFACGATKFANITPWSENTDNAQLFNSSLVRVAGVFGDGLGLASLFYQIYEVDNPQNPGLGFINWADQTYLVRSGRASFTAVFLKTSYSADLDVQVESFIETPSGTLAGLNSVTVNSQTGQFLAKLEVGTFFGTKYEITQEGQYFRVRIELEVSSFDPDVTETRFRNGIRINASQGDMLWIGGIQSGPSQFTSEYISTGSEPRLPTGRDECFNTRSTCQKPANYDRQTLPLKFVDKRSPLPKDDYYIPSLIGVSVTPAKLNPGGANRNASALGERAAVTLTFQDHPHNDRLVDPYRKERDYDPIERGTFWSKWRARNPYYMQRPITLRSGYMKDGQIVDEITRAFVITGFSGPDSSGRVQIRGKDVLTLAEDSKAQAPNVSTGRLGADITASATSLTLSPAGVGNIEYPASGFIRIGKEVMAFTRNADSMSITRGQFGTEVDEHDADDTVQLCLRYVSQAPQDILYDLLANYAGIPPAYLDKAGWDAEALDFLPRLYTAIVTEPEGVSKLISEMCQQMYFTIWFDERESLVKMRAVRVAQDDEVYELDDNMHLLQNSISWRDLSDELITQVWVFYGQNDPTEKLDQADNYAAVSVTIAPLAEGPDKHNLRRIKKIFSRWIDAGNASAAEDLGRRILNRYGNAPREVTFRVDAKDNYLWLGDYIRLTNRLRVDRFGMPSPANLQIFEAQESALGSEFQFTAQEFIPALTDGDEVEDPTVRTIPITSDFLNVNLRTLHDSQFGAPTGNETITFIVRNGVTIGGDAAGGGVNVPADQRVSTNDYTDGGNSLVAQNELGVTFAGGLVQSLQRAAIAQPRSFARGDSYPGIGPADLAFSEFPTGVAMRTGTWPAGVKINLVIEAGAAVVGEGGNGSGVATTSGVTVRSQDGATWRDFRGVPGGDGGDALLIENEIAITNGGRIYSAGGGGAPAGFTLDDNVLSGDNSAHYVMVSGGGGSGFKPALTATNRISTTRRTNEYAVSSTTSQPAAGSASAQGGRGDARIIGGIGFAVFGGGPSANTSCVIRSGAGGNLAGGAPSSVTASAAGAFGFSYDDSLSQGGQPGKAIRAGANLIEWINKGDVRGEEVN